ncbi:MAG: YegS/Rv2252/BmrU family lipid kinase [Clostridiales bacterium]
MKKAILLYNPKSGDRSVSKKLDYIVERFQDNNILVQPYRIGFDGFAKIKDIFNSKNFDMVIASGGDGTINSVGNYMLENKIDLPYGLIPSGTCNDFAKSLHIDTDLDNCIDIILKNNTLRVDVGRINDDEYFLGTCAGGLFVGASFNTNSQLKKNLGAFAYYLMGINEMKNLKAFSIKFETEEEIIEEEVFLFLILNGKNAAGFSDILKKADLDDGYMDIILVKKSRPIELAGVFFKVLHNDISELNNIRLIKAKRCYIYSDEGFNLSVDGEKGPKLPVKVEVIERALTVFRNF